MTRTIRDVGQIVAGQPHAGGGKFWCDFSLRATYTMRSKDAAVAAEAACDLFRQIIEMNRVTEYEWPPTTIEAIPHADFKGIEIRLITHAREPSIVVNLNPLGIHEAPPGLQ